MKKKGYFALNFPALDFHKCSWELSIIFDIFSAQTLIPYASMRDIDLQIWGTYLITHGISDIYAPKMSEMLDNYLPEIPFYLIIVDNM